MKNPKQKTKYHRRGFVLPVALLLCAITGCLALCGSYTHAWFVTERGAEGNEVETATYAVTVNKVYDLENMESIELTERNELGQVQYICPLAPEDLHYFILTANGTAYSGHCAVAVTDPDEEAASYVIPLAPDESCMVSLQAKKDSLLTFTFDWGTGEDPVEPASAFGGVGALLFYIEHSQTPHLIYEVAYGATLAGIADYYGVSVEDLCAYNGLDTDFNGTLDGEQLAIPYVEEHPEGGPYVPKGDLVVTVENAGDTVTPDNTYFVITGPDRYEVWIWYEDFVQGSYLLEELTAGEYEITMCAAERDNYTLETTGEMTALVGENYETEQVIVNTYTRHVGDLEIWLDVDGYDIPSDAVVVLTGPEDTYEISYDSFDDDSYCIEDLPTGNYTVELTDADVEGYTLTADAVEAVVELDETTEVKLRAEYERDLGNLEVLVKADGHDVPEEAIVVLKSKDETYRISYGDFEDGSYYVEDLPTGTYTVKLNDAEVEGYTLTVERDEVVVERDETVEAELTATYKRHLGNMKISVEANGCDVPADAVIVLKGPDDTYEISYDRFKDGSYYKKELPTGEYTVKLNDADVDGYTLTVYRAVVNVVHDEDTDAKLTAKYERQVGDLEITVEVSGASLPDGAWLEITGPDEYSEDIACESCTLTDLPTGEYSIYAEGVGLEGYDVDVKDITVEVTEEGASAHVSITYTAVPKAEPSGEGDVPVA